MSRLLHCLVLFLVFCLLLVGCSFRAPEMPTWEGQLNLPLMNEKYPIVDLARNDNIRVHENENSMEFFTEGEITGAEIAQDELRIASNPIGTGNIPVVESFSDKLSLVNGDETETQISYGLILSGELVFEFITLPEVASEIHVYFHELFDPDGKNLTLRILKQDLVFENGFIGLIHRHNMEYHTITNPDNEAIVENMHFDATVISSGGVPIPSGGYMKVFYDQPLFFSTIIGHLFNFRINADDFITDIDVDYPINIENALDMNEPELRFTIYSHVGFESTFYATVTSYNNRNNTSYSLNVTSLVNATTPGDSLLTTLIFTKEDNIHHLLNIAPDEIILSDAYFLLNNPDVGFGFASIGKAMSGSYINVVPFDFTFVADEPIKPANLTEVKISEKNREEIEKRALNAFFSMDLKNYYSVGATVNLFICSSDNQDLVYVKENLILPGFQRLTFLGSYMPRGSHLVATSDTFTFEILEEEIALFYKNEFIYVGMEITFEEGGTIIHPLESIDVIGNLKLMVMVDY